MIPVMQETIELDEIFSAFLTSLRNKAVVENFEHQFADYISTKYAVTFSQGRIEER